MRREVLLSAAMLAGCVIVDPTDDAGTEPASYEGLWSASWSFQVDLIATGTNYARDCAFHGSTTLSVWGENNFGEVRGTESMVCSNANNPSAQYRFGGHIEGDTGALSGQFFYWASDSLTFAGNCTSPTSCGATGSNNFMPTLTKQ